MRLYLIPLPVSENGEKFISTEVVTIIHSLRYFIVEKARTARRFIKNSGYQGKMEDLIFIELDKHNKDLPDFSILKPALDGNPMGLMSESGMPCIADPGSRIVSLAHRFGIRVIPLPGASSLFLALAASGLNGQNFRFEGYLPVKEDALNKKMTQIEKNIRSENSSHIFIETPYRNIKLASKILKEFPDNIRLCIALDITGKDEKIMTREISEWRKSGLPEMHKINCVFVLGR